MRLMTDKEREIAALKAIDGIHFYNLLAVRGGGHNRQAMGLMVFYGGCRILNYSQADPEFDLLLQRVLYQYHLEKGAHPIAADDLTRRILETGAVDLLHTMASPYQKRWSPDASLLPFARQRFGQVREIAVYLLEKLFAQREQRLEVTGFTGYRKKIALQVAVDGEERILLLRFLTHGALRCELAVGGAFPGDEGLRLYMEFCESGILAGWRTPDNRMRLHCHYRLGAAGLYIEESLWAGGELQSARADLVKQPLEDGRAQRAQVWLGLEGGPAPQAPVFELPWGGFCTGSGMRERLDGTYTQVTASTAYWMVGADSATVKLHVKKSLQAGDGALYVGTDAVVKSTTVCRVGAFGVAETRFEHDDIAMGSYKREVEGRCFYSLFATDGPLCDIREIHAHPIWQEDGVTAGHQLLDERTLHDIWEGSGIFGGISTISR